MAKKNNKTNIPKNNLGTPLDLETSDLTELLLQKHKDDLKNIFESEDEHTDKK